MVGRCREKLVVFQVQSFQGSSVRFEIFDHCFHFWCLSVCCVAFYQAAVEFCGMCQGYSFLLITAGSSCDIQAPCSMNKLYMSADSVFIEMGQHTFKVSKSGADMVTAASACEMSSIRLPTASHFFPFLKS